jgi:hypothetical protein
MPSKQPKVGSHMPLIVACSYTAILVLLTIFAGVIGMVGQDEFGYSSVPILYATSPLSLFLYRTHDVLFSVSIGGGMNAALLYALLKAIPSAKRSFQRYPKHG